MGDSLNALLGANRSASVLQGIANPTVVNPLAAIQGATQVAGNVIQLRRNQFDLQQAQLQPAYQAMRQVMATNPNPEWSDVQNALAQSARIGGNVDGLVANANETMARGGKPGDFIRAYGMGGMTPAEQGALAGPQRTAVQTGAGTVLGTTGGAWSPTAGQFTPGAFIQQGFTPGEASEFISVPQPDGTTKMVPRGALYGTGVPGASTVGGGASNQQAPNGPPPGANIAPNTPLSQNDQDLAAVAQRESGNQNIYSNVKVPGYTQQQGGSGYYQIIPSTWAEGQQLAGIPPAQRTATAIEASPQQQYQVATAIRAKYGLQPWAHSAPGAGGGAAAAGPQSTPGAAGSTGAAGPGGASGPFVGATSAQPVGGGVQSFSPTGAPLGQGGAQIPGVQRGPGGAPILTSLPPGTAQDVEQYKKAQFALPDQQTQDQNLNHAYEALRLITTGKGTENASALRNFLTTVGLAPSAMANDEAVYEIARKYTERTIAAAGNAGGTDTARAVAAASNPNVSLVNPANLAFLRNDIGKNRQAMAAVMNEKPENNGVGFGNRSMNFASTTDYRGFNWDQYSPSEQAQIKKSVGDSGPAHDALARAIGIGARLWQPKGPVSVVPQP